MAGSCCGGDVVDLRRVETRAAVDVVEVELAEVVAQRVQEAEAGSASAEEVEQSLPLEGHATDVPPASARLDWQLRSG